MKHIRMAHKSEDDFKKILLGAEEQGSAAYRPGMKAREQLEMTCVYCGVKRIGTCILKHLKNVHYDERTFKEVFMYNYYTKPQTISVTLIKSGSRISY